MKKAVLCIAMIIAIACLGGCGNRGSFADLDKMSEIEYSQVERIVKTTQNGETLTSHFTMTRGESARIDYTVEVINKVDINSLPESYKSEKKGSVTIQNDVISEQSGDSVDVDFVAMLKINFNFASEYFTNSEWIDGRRFEATVVDVKGFLNTDANCTQMKVCVLYLDVFVRITLDYVLNNGVTVQTVYNFTV